MPRDASAATLPSTLCRRGAVMQAPSAATASAAVGQLQGQLGLSGPEAQALVEAMPDLLGTKVRCAATLRRQGSTSARSHACA